MAHTAFTGVRVCSFSARNTLDKGTPLSPAIARSTLEGACNEIASGLCLLCKLRGELSAARKDTASWCEEAQQLTHLEFVDREMVVEQSMVTAGISIRMTPPVGLPYRACTVRNAP